jgi:anti-sigma regulatory factor (Ser/Thr protein kinase)
MTPAPARRPRPGRASWMAIPVVPHRGSPPRGGGDHLGVAVLVFPGHPQQVGPARRWAATLAGALGASPGDARLITSELVTNAIQHSCSSQRGGTITVAVTSGPGLVGIHVHDLGTSTGQLPAPRPAAANGDGLAEGNRGLWIVTALAKEWGTRPAACCPASQGGDPAAAAGGCCTWATVARQLAPGHTP